MPSEGEVPIRDFIQVQIDSLQAELDRRLHEIQREADYRFDSVAKAIDKSDAALEHRFASVNEFRAALADQAGTFTTRIEADTAHRRLDERISDLTDRVNVSSGRAGGLHAGWLYLLGAVTALGTVISLLHVITGG